MAQLTTLFVFGVLVNVALAQQLQVLYSSESIVLQNTSKPLQYSDYSKFVSLCLGYSSVKPLNWDGFYGYKDFANLPRSVVTLHSPVPLDSISSQSFQLEYNSVTEDQYASISHFMLSKYEDSFSEKIELFKNKASTLQKQIDSINEYLDQLRQLKLKNLLVSRMALWFDFASNGNTDEVTSQNFQHQVQDIVRSLRLLFDDKIVILSIVDPESISIKRFARQAQEAATKEAQDYNLAYAYDVDYHVAFTTIGFTTILLLLTVFGVSVAMWNIDPGRDSIIYRLTSQKMKKDQ